ADDIKRKRVPPRYEADLAVDGGWSIRSKCAVIEGAVLETVTGPTEKWPHARATQEQGEVQQVRSKGREHPEALVPPGRVAVVARGAIAGEEPRQVDAPQCARGEQLFELDDVRLEPVIVSSLASRSARSG